MDLFKLNYVYLSLYYYHPRIAIKYLIVVPTPSHGIRRYAGEAAGEKLVITMLSNETENWGFCEPEGSTSSFFRFDL